ncbi:MAG: ribonuclease Y [Nanoarchaeota archaeon]|nr:ribonuclease Y [Nanoarchaeota archaeon]
MSILNPVVLGGLALGLIIGYLARRWTALSRKESIERKAEEALRGAEARAKEIEFKAEEKAASILRSAQEDERTRKNELRKLEERFLGKEDELNAEKKAVEKAKEGQEAEKKRLADMEVEVREVQKKAVGELERVSGLSKEDAKQKLFEELKDLHRQEIGELLVKFERDKRDEVEKKSMEVITTSMQRYARQYIGDATTSVITIPSEDLKGKIIGREGRNIKAFERLTGVEVIVDESPETIIISSFDPMRRELARMSLQKLLKDGRIQPARIEEVVEESRAELDKQIEKAGEEAAYDVGILDLPKEITKILGRLNFRTSYGQNILQHSVEMTHIAGMMAAELGLNVEVAKKGALLHDIGKALDHEVEGTHVEIGRKLLKKYGVDERAIQAMEAHHEEYPYAIPEAYVVTTADIISGARPGARRDTLEKYLKRLEEIERVVNEFKGVNQSYAVAAGREVRVFVKPEKVDDFGAIQLAKEIAEKIHRDVRYPGEIKVTVIREVKAVEYAR